MKFSLSEDESFLTDPINKWIINEIDNLNKKRRGVHKKDKQRLHFRVVKKSLYSVVGENRYGIIKEVGATNSKVLAEYICLNSNINGHHTLMKKYFKLLDASLPMGSPSNLDYNFDIEEAKVSEPSVANADDILDEVFDSFVSKNFGDEAKARLPARKWIKK